MDFFFATSVNDIFLLKFYRKVFKLWEVEMTNQVLIMGVLAPNVVPLPQRGLLGACRGSINT